MCVSSVFPLHHGAFVYTSKQKLLYNPCSDVYTDYNMSKDTRTHATRAANKIYQGFRFSRANIDRLTTTATALRRKKTSVLEQLIEQYCAPKNLR
jgi:hypothetical protein